MADYYRLFLALHVISIICWMAGILYLFRLFVYHAAESENVVKERFSLMESKLYRIITIPGMWASAFFGALMIYTAPYLLTQPWLHLKLTFVLLLMGTTLWAGRIHRDLVGGTCRLSSKTFRFLNEVPTLLMIFIVLLVILKPF